MIVAGTGHRPDKLGGYDDKTAFNVMQGAVRWLEYRTPDEVISGGALGWDQCLALAAYYLQIPYTMALPFDGFDTRWRDRDRKRLENLCDNAAQIVYVCAPGYAPWKMQSRNQWMVNNCDLVLALWDGSDGGTANCIRYAEKVGKPIENLWEMYVSN